jgi:DNA-binding XRE family transcriptional regulator
MMCGQQSGPKRQWRDYHTASGARPIRDFLLALPDEDRAAILEEMDFKKRRSKHPRLTSSEQNNDWQIGDGEGKQSEREHERRVCMEQDFLDEMIEESTRRNPQFPSLMEEAHQRRALLEALAAIRSRSRISQSALAKRIHTSQSAIARLEAGIVDPRLSTIQRYAASVGKRIQWTLVDA